MGRTRWIVTNEKLIVAQKVINIDEYKKTVQYSVRDDKDCASRIVLESTPYKNGMSKVTKIKLPLVKNHKTVEGNFHTCGNNKYFEIEFGDYYENGFVVHMSPKFLSAILRIAKQEHKYMHLNSRSRSAEVNALKKVMDESFGEIKPAKKKRRKKKASTP